MHFLRLDKRKFSQSTSGAKRLLTQLESHTLLRLSEFGLVSPERNCLFSPFCLCQRVNAFQPATADSRTFELCLCATCFPWTYVCCSPQEKLVFPKKIAIYEVFVCAVGLPRRCGAGLLDQDFVALHRRPAFCAPWRLFFLNIFCAASCPTAAGGLTKTPTTYL